jgi:hypothetical protein
MIMDNLSAHNGPRVRVLIEERGCELLNLPLYSPGFQSDRSSLLEHQGAPTKSRGTHLRGVGGGDG